MNWISLLIFSFVLTCSNQALSNVPSVVSCDSEAESEIKFIKYKAPWFPKWERSGVNIVAKITLKLTVSPGGQLIDSNVTNVEILEFTLPSESEDIIPPIKRVLGRKAIQVSELWKFSTSNNEFNRCGIVEVDMIYDSRISQMK